MQATQLCKHAVMCCSGSSNLVTSWATLSARQAQTGSGVALTMAVAAAAHVIARVTNVTIFAALFDR